MGNQIKEVDDSLKQHKVKAPKRYSLFIDRYVGTIKAQSFDFSNIEHIYIKSSILDPIITLKDELGLGPKTIVSIIKVDYEKILPGLPTMLNNVTTVIIAKSANIHKNHEPENELNDTVRTRYDIIDLETGPLVEQNKCDSIKIPYSNDMNNFNKDFVCKVLKSFDNNTGYLLSKTYSVCNCYNLELLHDNSSNNYQSDAQSVPRETSSASAKETMDCLPNTRINDSKLQLKYEENVPMVFIKDIKPDFVGKQEFVDYEDLYKKVTNQSTTRVKHIYDDISVSEPCGQNLISPTVLMKDAYLGYSNGSNNIHETLIKNKLKGEMKEKSSEPHKYKKIANKQTNIIKSEQCISRFTQPKSSEKCTDSAYLKKTNTLPGKLTKCKSQIGSNIKTAKKNKKRKRKKNDGNNQLNIKPEVSEQVSNTYKIHKNSKFKSPWYKTIALHEKKPSSIKSESSVIGNNPTRNTGKDTCLGFSKESNNIHETLIKSKLKRGIKVKSSEPHKYKKIANKQANNIKSEQCISIFTQTKCCPNCTEKCKDSAYLKKNTLPGKLTKCKSQLGSNNKTAMKNKKRRKEKKKSAYNSSSLHAGLDPIGGKKNSVSISDNLSIDAQNSTLHCFLYNSIIESNNCQLDYDVVKNCDAILIPPLPNGDCTLLIQSMNGYRSFIVPRYNFVCVNGTTVQCNSINMPMDICFDGILKRDGTVKTILVMWVGIKPDFFDSYRLINGNPETIDFIDCKGICSRIGEKMIIKTHIRNNNLTLKCSDSIISREILNINQTNSIPNDTDVSLYIRKRNQKYNKPIWTITWMILHLHFL